MVTTVGQVMVNEALPPEHQDFNRVMDKDAADSVLADIATANPQLYREISHKLMQLGRHASFEEGSTLRLSDLTSPVAGRKVTFDFLRKKEDEIDDSDMTHEEKHEAKSTLFSAAADAMANDTYSNGLTSGNPFALQVKAKARGNKGQLSSLLSTPGTYANHKGEMVPVFIKRSYAEGLNPEEYWAAAHGGRVGVLCLDPATEVRQPNGNTVAIKDIKAGDPVLAVDMQGKLHPTTVTRVYDNGVQPVYEYSFRRMASRAFVSVRATQSHKLLSRLWCRGSRGSRRALSDAGLNPLSKVRLCKSSDDNAYVACLPTGMSDGAYGRDHDLALLLGMLVGDGCTAASMEGSIEFSCADPVLIADTKDYIAQFGLELHKTASCNFTWTLRKLADYPHEWSTANDGRRIANLARASLWNEYGGKYAHQKTIPAEIGEWSNKSCADFIAGYTATDGCVCTPKTGRGWISYGSTSRELLEGVKNLLEIRFGIWTNPISDPVTKGRVNPLYTLSITHNESLRRFKAAIPVVGIKRYRLAAMDVEPVVDRSSAMGCRVNSCTYVGDMATMDIEVDHPDHMFLLANGLISSNSTKTGTAKGGYLGKLLSSAAMEVVITGEDCTTEHGIPVKPDDPDNIGAVLARKAGPFSAGTVLTKQAIASLSKNGVDEIVLRSPITCGMGKGICQQCAGKREKGGFPPLGYHLGAVSASAMAEQVAQQALNCLAGDTLVKMAEGPAKPIRDIVVGDMVIGSDLKGNTRPVKVTHFFNHGVQPCLATELSLGQAGPVYIKSTANHKFLCRVGDYSGASVITIGGRGSDVCVLVSGGNRAYITDQASCGNLATYDIEVDHPDHLFVLANGLITSNSKHSGKKHKGEGFSGFEVIKNLATAPETYPDRSAVATLDGKVDKVEPAPQGGTNIHINGEIHHALPDMDVFVKSGDSVEAGDILSDGVANPADVVRYKGLGEGRRYFADRFTKAFRDSGLGINRRNAEAISSALVNHVTIDDEDGEGDSMIGDTVTYSNWAKGYKPRPTSVDNPVNKAVGQYMDAPALHYSIGTRITPSIAARLTKHGYKTVMSNPAPVSVTPTFKSVVKTPEFMDDWMARLGSSYLETRLIKDVQLGAESDAHGLNPIPGLAKTTEFGSPPKGSISPY